MVAPRHRSAPYRTAGRIPAVDGFTLIELLITLVVFAAALGGIVAAFVNFGAHSADPMIRAQALSIAHAYLDEAVLKDFSDPDAAETNSCEAGESRPDYDDVWDYDCVSDTGARNQYDEAIPSLNDYTVAVNVTASSIGAVATARIAVSVSHATGINLSLVSHRANY